LLAVTNNWQISNPTNTTTISQPLAGTSQLRTEEDFVGAKFYCPHALADGNQRIQIRKKTLAKFS